MRGRILLSSAGLVFALGAGAGISGAGQKKEDIILAELKQIQAQLAQLQTSQASLKSAVDGLTEGATEQQDALRKSLADSRITIERIQQDMSILSERIEETNERIGGLGEELVSMRQNQAPIVIPGPENGEAPTGPEEATSPTGAPSAPAPPVLATAPGVTDIYNQARIDYTQGRYALAISGFKEALDLEPKGDLADNARYWMGESYLAQRQYELALAEFDRIIRDYPQSNKRPDAYLKKAMTLEEMGRRSEANVMYELVIEQFPKTTQERVARRKLEELMKTMPRQQEP